MAGQSIISVALAIAAQSLSMFASLLTLRRTVAGQSTTTATGAIVAHGLQMLLSLPIKPCRVACLTTKPLLAIALRVTNVTFSANSAQNGGAIYSDGSFSGNVAPLLTNAILWNNTASNLGNQLYNVAAKPTISYTLIASATNEIFNDHSSVIWGDTILNADPALCRCRGWRPLSAKRFASH